MAVHTITRGLDLPVTGALEQKVHHKAHVSRVAIVADDYPFMKPRMHVTVGDEVKRGQLLFEDRKTEGVRFTAPGAGTVVAIHRGERRALQSVVIELNETEQTDAVDASAFVTFEHFKAGTPVAELGRQGVIDLLVESGLFTAIRRRPFEKVPSPKETCHSVFVTAMDSNPLAANPEHIIKDAQADFDRGMEVVSQLTEGKVFLCVRQDSAVKSEAPRVQREAFAGPHPSGLVGTHIHVLDPVHASKSVWHVGYQDVIAFGRLFETGQLPVERVVSLAGPTVITPRLIKTRLGADLAPLVEGEMSGEDNRVISGSMLYGRKAMGEVEGYLGRYSQQITCMAEDRERRFIGWLSPSAKLFSTLRVTLGGLGGKRFDFGTSTHGSHRAMVPLGMFERVMPLDIIPTFLLRALARNDLERAEGLGCLELAEEDLALCTMVDPGKEDWGVILRENLTLIWKEG
ncbi:Na(+)-translocating NADH-quinone reductase subunit A [Myxococcota bacterium]|nr:Na(+)-translocating NADH-quinone reductase subunit A [Myxococcota bacterium]MBU1899663.1 Na(+)-translocating NADH-quinone reductase subunit A [Myxococcota bacterium]